MDINEMKILSIGVAQKMAQRASARNDYSKMKEIWLCVANDPSVIGDANDYHNYSVVMSREDDYLAAYEIVARGLKQFPYNTDLLADAIYYGSNCQKYSECEEHVNVLLSRPYSSWTWRAFSFLIDYFKNRWDWVTDVKSVEDGLEIALEVAKSYQKYLPSEERSYVAEYEVHQSLAKIAIDNDDIDGAVRHREDALALLENTINNGEYSAVQCAMRYADALFEQRKYEKVIEICKKALEFGEETASAKLGHFMYLSAQSNEILLYQNNSWRDESKVNEVYSEYIAALADTNESYERNIQTRVKILAARSGVKAPEEIMASDSTKIDLNEIKDLLINNYRI